MRKALTIALLTGVLATAAGCGGGGGSGGSGNTVSAAEWASSVCAAVGGWSTDLQAESDSLGAAMSGATSVADVRAKFVEFLENAIKRSEQMIDEAEAAGTPDVDDGEAIVNDVMDQLNAFKAALEDARDTAEALPDDPAGFTQGATEIGTTMEQVGQDAQTGFDEIDDKYKSEELSDAFANEPACKSLSES